MMDFLVMTLRADGTTVLSSVTQIASPDGRCLMICRRLPVQSDGGTTGRSACSVCGWWVGAERRVRGGAAGSNQTATGCWDECFGVERRLAAWGARTLYGRQTCQIFLQRKMKV